MTRRQFLLTGASAVVMGVAPGAMGLEIKRLRGLVTEVSDTTIKIRGTDGKVVTFRLDRKVGMTLAHLKEHMREKEPVTIFYREEGNELVATRITD